MIDINALLTDQINRRGSDLHLKIGRPPLFRIAGEITPTDHPVVTEQDMVTALQALLGAEGWAKLQKESEFDTAYMVPNLARFRVNAFRRMGQYGVVARAIPLKPPTFDKMTMPPVLKDMLNVPQGMILVTGPTGSGKSTTLACMIEHLNQSQPLHIVTVEDPIEFVYSDSKATVSQRQLGSDVASLQEALKRVLRQDPDVILLGEMRDRETIEMAMHAAETGHLVFSTLHTNDAKQTIDRIIDVFPADARDHIRGMLSLTLHAIISQRLVRRAGGTGRVAAMEVLINTPNVRELIAANKMRDIENAMKTGTFYRMQTFNQALAKLVQDNLVTLEEAEKTSPNPNELKMIVRGIQSGSAQSTAAQPGSGTSVTPAPGAAAAADKSSSGLKITRGY
jgi:twitching motility protein PilT